MSKNALFLPNSRPAGGAAAAERLAQCLRIAGAADAHAGELPQRRCRPLCPGRQQAGGHDRCAGVLCHQPRRGHREARADPHRAAQRAAAHGRGARAHRRRDAHLGGAAPPVDQRRPRRAADRAAGDAGAAGLDRPDRQGGRPAGRQGLLRAGEQGAGRQPEPGPAGLRARLQQHHAARRGAGGAVAPLHRPAHGGAGLPVAVGAARS